MVQVVLVLPAGKRDEDCVLLFLALFSAALLALKVNLPLREISHRLYSDKAVAHLSFLVIVITSNELRRVHSYCLELCQSVFQHHDLHLQHHQELTLVSKFLARLWKISSLPRV